MASGILLKYALRSVPVILIFSLLGSIVLVQFLSQKTNLKNPIPPALIIPSKIIKLTDLGLHSAMSSLLWVYAIQRMASSIADLPEIINSVNDMDLKFSYPYAFSALVLPGINFPDKGVDIAERGIREADPDWRIPFYLATTYHIYFKDRQKALYYFDLAANTPGATDQVKRVAARYGAAENLLEQTKQIWISIYESSDDEIVIERAKNNIIHIEMVEALEKAIQIYRDKYGFRPQNLNDLVSTRILKGIPKSPLGVEFEIDTAGRISFQ